MRRYRLTIAFTLFALALCIFNFSGLDPDELFFFFFSIPVWIIETFSDIHYYNVYFVYLLTILTYAAIGRFADHFLNTRRAG